jgi:hypothetical protein
LPFDVWPTPTAAGDLAAMRGPARTAARRARADFEASGCAAAHYRLLARDVEGICCRHLHGAWRMIVAFPTPSEVCALLVGRHTQGDVGDVYARLYEALGIGVPDGGRDKPPCCEDAAMPPVEEGLVGSFLTLTRELQRLRRRQR